MTSALDFRSTLGQFPTGVTIVTALNRQGQPMGMTVSSFNSVSLDPKLVLWSIDKSALSFDDFLAAKHYSIHVLKEEQQTLCLQFATRDIDKFANVEIGVNDQNIPVIPDVLARFDCEIEHQYDGGDHIILVGKVLNHFSSEGTPLVFHAGQFKTLNHS